MVDCCASVVEGFSGLGSGLGIAAAGAAAVGFAVRMTGFGRPAGVMAACTFFLRWRSAPIVSVEPAFLPNPNQPLMTCQSSWTRRRPTSSEMRQASAMRNQSKTGRELSRVERGDVKTPSECRGLHSQGGGAEEAVGGAEVHAGKAIRI